MQKELIQDGIYYAECGYTIIRVKGKVPVDANWPQAEYIWPEDVPKFLEGRDGFGVVLTKRDLVIDVDPRNFKEGDKPHARLFQTCGIEAKEYAAIARTGGGGLHIYFRLPDNFKVKESHPEYPGVEFKSRGRQVIGVGSLHPTTGKHYTWAGGCKLRDIKEAPASLLGIIARQELAIQPHKTTNKLVEGSTDADFEVISRYIEYLKTVPGAVQGTQGDKTTYNVACKGRDLGLSRAKTTALMLQHYNHRCTPDWRPEELEAKVRNAYHYATGEVGAALPEADFSKIENGERHALWRGWDRMANGKLAKTLNNVFNYFIQSDSPFRETVGFDEFNGQVKILKKLPWHENNLPKGGLEWKDEDSVQLRLWLSREKEFDVQLHVVDQAVLVAAQLKLLHPVKDYLRALKWDGTPRLESWIIDYAGAQDNKFVREASKKFLLQAVSRVYHPGCKADHVVVLEGEQGVGKSSLVEIMGGAWYGDIVIDPHARDTVDAIRGKWFVELSEMEVVRRADAQALKAFITRRTDRVRLAYGRRAVDLPRQCVFVGTINPDATNEYLIDSTGNRRIWPIAIRKVAFGALQGIRDQLFAEAVDLVMKGEATYIIDKDILGMAVEEQRARQTTDPWYSIIEEWLSDRPYQFLKTKDVWIYALKGTEASLQALQQRRIAGCLKELGFVQHVKRENSRVVRGYIHQSCVSLEKQLGDLLS